MRTVRWIGFLSLVLVFGAGALPATLLAEGLDVQPSRVELRGQRDQQRLVVTGGSDGSSESIRDLTHAAQYSSSDSSIVEARAGGVLLPRGNGTAVVRVRNADGVTVDVPVEVSAMDVALAVSFRHSVAAVLGKHGCNSGACHGSPKGKNGFRLSLRGHDPDLDYETLTREVVSRRTNLSTPEDSLMLLKATGIVAHQGGKRFSTDSKDYGFLHDWIVEGLNDDREAAAPLVRLEVFPSRRALRPPAASQQLLITAHYADGSRRDVTDLCVYSVSDKEIADVGVLGLVERKSKGEVAVLVRYLDQMRTARLTFLPEEATDHLTYPKPQSYIDQLVFDKLRLLGIPASPRADDNEFLRRVYLDTISLLPTSAQVRAFLSDSTPDKRARLIDGLLERPEFVDYWSMKWLDVLSSSRKNLGGIAVHRFQRWVHNAIASRMPLDEMVRQLVTANGDVNQNPAGNFYRVAAEPHERAEITAQLFLGVRMECARCHNHPFERWTQDDYYGMAAFFAGVKIKGPGPDAGGNNAKVKDDRQVVWYDARAPKVTHPGRGTTVDPRAFGEDVPEESASAGSARVLDPRQGLARWLTSESNPFFAPSVANRIWYHLFGRGIVDPVDDFRDSNPPSNDELLAALAADLAQSQFDLRHVIRQILNSETYQRTSRTVDGNENDIKYFSHSVPRLLGAEQLLDSLCQVSGIPETYEGFPPGTRAVQLPDPGVENGFLAAFGKPQRNIACECEREGDGATISQALEMVRGDTVHAKIRNEKNTLGKMLERKLGDDDVINELYLSTVSRPPREAEKKTALQFVAQSEDRRQALEDVLWALFNSKEFLFRR